MMPSPRSDSYSVSKTLKWYLAFGFLAVLGTACGVWEHGFAHDIGIDTQASQEYAFFSGFGTWLLAVIGYSGVIATVTRSLNCHAPGCPRLGRFPVAGGMYKVCHRHHPEEHVRDKTLTLQHIHDAHWRLHGKLE